MSKVAIKGNPLGNAVFTIESPPTDGDRTFVLPDNTGTIITTDDVGTIASQDANIVDIDGGSIDGTAIGASSASTGNFTDLNASGQVIIPEGVTLGTAAGVYNADNTLDDYETGTWTPTAADQSGNAITLLSSAVGRYIKIGKNVFITSRIDISSLSGTNSGEDLRVASLPFAATSKISPSRYSGSIQFNNVPFLTSNPSLVFVVANLSAGNSFVDFRPSSNNAGIPALECQDFNNSSSIIFSISYETD